MKQLHSLPKEVLERYEKWKDIAMISGPRGLRFINEFRDDGLRGAWKGCRSSRLGLKYRVMYEIVESEVLAKVVSLTALDYRRK